MKTPAAPLSRGHKKRERTRAQLITAGVAVLAQKGEALTISDVVVEAQVSNGTFYNYFADREELMGALAEHSATAFAAQAAIESTEEDPARQFAFVTLRVLRRAIDDPVWGRAILRLTDDQRSFPRAVSRYMQEDLAAGFEQGRFAYGPDDVTLDLITGLLMSSVRRIVRGEAPPGHAERVVERALIALGVAQEEAAQLAADAHAQV